jgi:hypothetical protein
LTLKVGGGAAACHDENQAPKRTESPRANISIARLGQ